MNERLNALLRELDRAVAAADPTARPTTSLNLAPPSALRFVPCDFETRAVSDALVDAGFIADAPTFVSWLGVTQYLTRDAIAETFHWMSHLSAGSEMVLTFVVPGPDAEEKLQHGARGTRFETFFTPEQVVAFLAEADLDAEVFAPETIDHLYFRDRDDDLHASTLEWLIVGSTV